MDQICSPYAFEVSLANECFSDFFIYTLDSLLFIILISVNTYTKSSKNISLISQNFLILLIFTTLLYFLSLTFLLFYEPTNSISVAEALKLTLQIILWLLVTNSYYNHYTYTEFGLSYLFSLKLFSGFRILSVIYSITLFFLIPYKLEITLMNTLELISVCLLFVYSTNIAMPERISRSISLIEVEGRVLNNYEKSNIFSKLIMNWAYPLLKLGNTKTIEYTDIDKIREIESSVYQKQKIEKRIQEVHNNTDKYGLAKIIYKAYFFEILFVTTIGVFSAILEFSAPVFVNLIENFLASEEPLWKGVAIVVYLLLTKFVYSIVTNQYDFLTNLLSSHVKASLSSEIYEKLLKISISSISDTNKNSLSYGKIINLIQVDLDGIASGILNSMNVIILPFTWGIGFYLLFVTIGINGGIAGTLLIILLLSINVILSRKQSQNQKALMEKKDARLKVCNELLGNIRIFKIYNWEQKLSEKIEKAREAELLKQKSVFFIHSCVIFLSWGAQNYLAIAIIVTMTLSGIQLTPTSLYAGLSVVRVIRNSFNVLPNIINNFIQTKISLGRIQDYLRTKDQGVYIQNVSKSNSILVRNASFAWEIPEKSLTGELQTTKTVLKSLNFEASPGEIIAVVGKVASGKSSFLQSLIQNLHFVKTQEDSLMSVNGSLAFCSQEAWIQNKTIKENILFNKQLDVQRYENVIKVCMLESDIEMLPGGDLTEIGERGINLSGGQKARVNIARAVYSNSDIYLFDDPLAALDQYVGKQLFEECILKFLDGKTRIIVTNNQQFLSAADKILVFHEGSIVQQGHFNQISKEKGYFRDEFMVNLKQNSVENRNQESTQEKNSDKKRERKLIESEERAVGSVKFEVYKTYYKYAGGLAFIIFALFIMISWQVDRMLTDIYLAAWTNQSESEQESKRTQNILIFSAGSFTINIFMFLRSYNTFSAGIRASRLMFRKMLQSLQDASIPLFYDINPMGRILNRLSKDQNFVDSTIPNSTNFSTAQIFNILFTITFCIYTVPLMLVSIPVALYLALKIQKFYLKSSREITRLESMSKSPIIQHFSETLAGLATIRAFGYTGDFIKKYYELIDKNTSLLFYKAGCLSWLGVALELISDIVLGVSALVIVCSRSYIDPGLAGNCLVYMMVLPDNIYNTIFATSNLENAMVSVERIHGMTLCESEDLRKRFKDSDLQHKNWPKHGSIEFQNYSTRYRPDTEIVLKSIDFVINPHEKIGIMGRTGSGKSSLVNALFRVIEPVQGRIVIDGIDINEVGLDLLRQKLSVIPQDPALFQGKLKENIDPLNQFSDTKILKYIELVNLNLGNHPLDIDIKEGASNLSVGQKQLVCIVRALLRKSKIILLDEATASIDFKTDEIIQRIVKEKFKNCTVLTIAHRINTILHSDRILVMENGKVAEFDTPENLQKMNGVFSKLALSF